MNCSGFNSVNDLAFLFIRADSKWLDSCCDCQPHKSEGFLIGHCLPLIFEEANTNDTSCLLRALNTLNRLSTILCQFSFPLPAHRQNKLCEFCFNLLDFPADSVGFQAVAILRNLFELHRLDCANCLGQCRQSSLNQYPNTFCSWVLSIGQKLIPLNANGPSIMSKQRAKAMQSLLQINPELRPKLMTEENMEILYKQMENTSIDAQISHLVVDDICAALSSRKYSNGRLQFHLESIKQQLLNADINVEADNREKIASNFASLTGIKGLVSREICLIHRQININKIFHNFIFDFPHSSSAHSQRALCYLLRLAIQHSNGYRNDCCLNWLDLLREEEDAEQIMRRTLESPDFETRLSAWSLLCSHPKGAQPVLPVEIRLAQQFLPANLHLKSPSARQSIFTQLEKLISRIREHSKSLLKSLPKNGMQTNSEQERQIQSYRNFFHWLHQLAFEWIAASDWHKNLIANLENQQNGGINLENGGINLDEGNDEEEEEEEEGNVPFCARISALTLLSKLYLSIPVEEDPFSRHFRIWEWIGENERRKLRQALDDRYEVCQEIALKLLNRFWSKYSESVEIGEEEWILLAISPFMPRHQQAIEYRLRFLLPKIDSHSKNEFIEKLIAKIEAKCAIIKGEGHQKHLLSLIQSPQLHALIAALQTALPFVELDFQGKESILGRIISLCHFCAQLISPVVHSMSPEGFLPTQNDSHLFGDESCFISAQQLARTCFRAHRAISGIFAEIIKEMPHSRALSDDQLQGIGFKYFWKQLTECRHRGAFEAAAEAFQIVCRRFWEFSGQREDFPCNPSKWIKQIMSALMGQNVDHQFCVTRRSAGLPHLVSTILATNLDPNALPVLFNSTIGQLLKCRELEDSQLEVHCVNILRLLFVNSNFSELVLPHVESAFHSVLDGLTSEFWPVRNAHTQLFAALTKRLFGTPSDPQRSLHVQPKCKQSAHEFFTRHPSLFPLLLNHLAQIASALEAKTFGIRHFLLSFPLLIIFTHLRPVPQIQEDFPLHPFLPNLIRLMLSFPARQQRELASAAILSISTQTQLERILDWLARTSFPCSQNFIDGIHIFVSQIEELDASEKVWKLKEWLADRKGRKIDLNLN